MKRRVLFLLLVLGLYTTPSCATSRQYHYVSDPKNWTEAQSYCRETYTDLATIDNIDDMNKLILSAGSTAYGWIGLYDDINSWRWSLEDSQYYGEGEAGFRNWNSLQPDNVNGNQLCALMRKNGRWNDARCENKRSFICYDARADSSSRFVLITEQLTWTEAQRFCRQNHTDLVSVRNQTEDQQIQALAGGNRVWIGLFRNGWGWSDNSSSTFRHWESGEPNNNVGTNEHCVEVWRDHGGRWNDETCSALRPFFCHRGGLTVLRIKFTSEAELTESDITELLKQLRDELIRRGLPSNIKLSRKKP